MFDSPYTMRTRLGLTGDGAVVDPRELMMSQGLMGMGAALLTPQSRGGGLGAALSQMQQAQLLGMQMQRQGRLDEMQANKYALDAEKERLIIDEAKKKLEQEKQLLETAKKYMRTPEQVALSAGGGPTNKAAELLPAAQTVGPQFDQQGFLAEYSALDPIKALELRQKLSKTTEPTIVPKDAALWDPINKKTLYENRVPEKLDPNKPFLGVGPDGQPIPNPAYQQYELARARAGGTRVSLSVPVNTDKTFFGGIGEVVGKSIGEGRDAALSAGKTIAQASQLAAALDSGKVITGPVAQPELVLRQVGEVLGVGGKDNAEKLTNTRVAIKSLAQMSLNAAGQLKGQGQVTDFERKLLERAASGDITFSEPELRAVAKAADKVARATIQQHNANAERLSADPRTGGMGQYLQVPEPPAYTSPVQPQVNTGQSVSGPITQPNGWGIQRVR